MGPGPGVKNGSKNLMKFSGRHEEISKGNGNENASGKGNG